MGFGGVYCHLGVPTHLGTPPLICGSPPQMEQEVSQFIQATGEPRRRFQPMNKIERSIL